MASLAHVQCSACPTCDLLRANFKKLLDVYHRVCLLHLELGGIEAASTWSRIYQVPRSTQHALTALQRTWRLSFEMICPSGVTIKPSKHGIVTGDPKCTSPARHLGV